VGVVTVIVDEPWRGPLAVLLDLTDDDDALTHTACPHDEDRALCGVSLVGAAWRKDDGPTPDDCLVCEDLDESGECSCPAWTVWAWTVWAVRR
jgi:hypothetical protein